MLIMGNFLTLIIIPYNYWYYKVLMLDDMIGKRSNGLKFGRWTFKPKTLKRLYFLINTL